MYFKTLRKVRFLLRKLAAEKLLLYMRLTTIILLATVLQASATDGIAQKKVTLRFNNVPVKKIFKEIIRQTGVSIIYKDSNVGQLSKVSIDVKDAAIEDVLQICFKDQPYSFYVANNAIVINQKRFDNRSAPILIDQPPVDLKGRIVDESGNPLSGASVSIKGSNVGISTKADGTFSIVSPEQTGILVITYIGYESKELSFAATSSVFNVVLKRLENTTDEVVVIGYGTRNKKDLTGSIAQVKTAELESVPVYNIEEALKGRASGVQVTHNSGAPGSRIEVRIRGANSMIGDNAPLYVVDGFPVTGGIDFLNPSDIESIDILKDASATAIYGSRGANGVVIITSKRGKIKDRSSVTFHSFYGIQRVSKKYNMLNAKQYATVVNDFLKNDGQAPYFDVDQIENPGTDWQDLIFRNAPLQNHTLTFAGNSDKTNYSLSANYYNQEGIIINSGSQRGSLRFNLDHEVKSWLNLSSNIALSRREVSASAVDNGDRGTTMFSHALSAAPTLSPYDANGQYVRVEQVYPFTDPADMRNPLLWNKPRKDKSLSNSFLINNALDIKFSKDLSFRTRLGLEYQNTLADFFNPIIFENDRGSASSGSSYMNSFLNENTVNYTKSLNHEQRLDLVAGFTYQKYIDRFTNISVSGFSNNVTENYNLAAAQTVNPPSSGISEWSLASWLGRVNYSLHNKYYITASARADGSSRFGEDNKWGVFPSGAIAWRVSEEDFLKNVKFVSDFKLRVSYGVTGNTGLSPYQSLNRLAPVNYINSGQTASIGYVPSGLSNSQLRWETTKQLDLGFDLSIFNSRIDFTFDYYKKNTDNLLASVPLPPSIGFGSVLQNIGKVENQGVELGISADIINKKLKWTVSGQISANRNKVISIAGGSDIVSFGTAVLPGMNLARVGEPLGVFYGYLEDGLTDEGFIKYVDINKDGSVNSLDRIILGTPYPKFTYGFNSSISYRNFDLNIFIQGSSGNDIFWRTAFTNLNSFQRTQNQFADLFNNYWTESKPDPHAKYPKPSSSTQMLGSDRLIKDGSYLRIKSLQIGYNFNSLVTKKHWLKDLRIYFSAINLLTWTNYPGLDPEVNTSGNDSQTIGNRLQIGMDASGYPSARTFGAGIQFSF